MNLLKHILEATNDNAAYKELKGLKFAKPDDQAAKPSPAESSSNSAKNKGFNFVVMVKKGNKTQYHNMEVPMTSDFANQVILLLFSLKIKINERCNMFSFKSSLPTEFTLVQFKNLF